MCEALRKAAPADWHPMQKRARGGGERATFADADQKSPHDQRRHAGGDAGHHGGHAPQRAQQREAEARTKLISEPPAGNLHERVRIGECGEDDAELRRAQAHLFPHERSGNGDVDAINVENERHQAEAEQRQVADFDG